VPDARPADAGRVAMALAVALRRGHCAPLLRAYRQILTLLLLAVGAGCAIYYWLFGHAAMQQLKGVGYMSGNGWQDVLGVLLVFAPVLLCFVPLFLPGMRRIARDDAALRIFRTRALWLLALGWLAPVGLWLVDLGFSAASGNRQASFGVGSDPQKLMPVPGQLPLALPLAFAAAGLVAIRLLHRYRSLQRLDVRAPRLRARHIALRVAVLLVLGALILFVQIIAENPILY
jgi:hypothetical protein